METHAFAKRRLTRRGRFGIAGMAVIAMALIVRALSVERKNTSGIVINGTPVTIETIATPLERERGLSGRDALTPNNGVLFVFDEESKPGIWMKNMKFSIDILWLDADGTVVDMRQNVSPSTYPTVFMPQAVARYVLELSANFSRDHGVNIGTDIDL